MGITKPKKDYIQGLKASFDSLSKGKKELLNMIDDVEIAEAVYNSNAIENSTLTLKETEKILLEMELGRDLSLREVYEAKNLARVVNYIRSKAQEKEIDKELILFLHQMLIGGINDDIAGRFREQGEYVRVANYIAPAPEKIETMIDNALVSYSSCLDRYFLERISRFHLDFECVHPFCDGNGRMGRVIINYQLKRIGFPSVIIRDKEKADYYLSFGEYQEKGLTKKMDTILELALTESLHKRLAYLRGDKIIKLADYARANEKSSQTIFNAAKRQTIAAFREKEVWKIAEKTI